VILLDGKSGFEMGSTYTFGPAGGVCQVSHFTATSVARVGATCSFTLRKVSRVS
jgi:hypothetical protein